MSLYGVLRVLANRPLLHVARSLDRVTAPILNSALYDELRKARDGAEARAGAFPRKTQPDTKRLRSGAR